MKIKTLDKRWLLPLGSMIAASAIGVASWFAVAALRSGTNDQEMTVRSLSMNRYSTLEDLSESADVVVLGTVRSIAATGIGRGSEGEGNPMPYTIYELEVQETFKGGVSGTIYVGRTDPSYFEDSLVFDDAPLTKLNTGEKVVLYLRKLNADVEPTIPIEGLDYVYVPLSLDNGVFDVSGAVGVVGETAEVRPRGIGSSMFAEGSVFTTADIRGILEPDSDEEGPVGNTE